MNKKSIVTHTILTLIGLFLGICVGLYFSTRILLTATAATETNFLVAVHEFIDKGNTQKTKQLIEQMIDCNVQELKRMSSATPTILKDWTSMIKFSSEQRNASIQLTERYFKNKKSELSESTKVYLEQQTQK